MKTQCLIMITRTNEAGFQYRTNSLDTIASTEMLLLASYVLFYLVKCITYFLGERTFETCSRKIGPLFAARHGLILNDPFHVSYQ